MLLVCRPRSLSVVADVLEVSCRLPDEALVGLETACLVFGSFPRDCLSELSTDEYKEELDKEGGRGLVGNLHLYNSTILFFTLSRMLVPSDCFKRLTALLRSSVFLPDLGLPQVQSTSCNSVILKLISML